MTELSANGTEVALLYRMGIAGDLSGWLDEQVCLQSNSWILTCCRFRGGAQSTWKRSGKLRPEVILEKAIEWCKRQGWVVREVV